MKKTFSHPDSAEREYMRLLIGYAAGLAADANAILIPKIGAIKREFESDARSDSFTETLAELMAQLLSLAGQRLGFVEQKLPFQYAAVSKFNNGQFKLVVKANTGIHVPDVMQGAPKAVSLGINIFRSEPFLRPLMEGWISENV
ncbi:MAG: hypothetical protein ACRC0J_01775, partial [Shewanella oncorhynchi]